MNIDYLFLTFADLKQGSYGTASDPEQILHSGIALYRSALLENPYSNNDDNKHAMCLAIVDGKIVGRFMLFRSILKVGEKTLPIQTSGGLIVSERYRGFGIGTGLIRITEKNEFHCAALFSRSAYNIRKKSDVMLEIPQYVKIQYQGIKKVLDIPITIKLYLLKRRFDVKRLSVVPEWAGTMVTTDLHKYMELHNTKWLQWALDHTSTGNEFDHQSFFAVYDKKDNPIGFFMTKTRSVNKDGGQFIKANLIEWASSDLEVLDELDMNIFALNTCDSSVSRFWTISEKTQTGRVLKRYSFKRRGWFAMSIKKDKRFDDIDDMSRWRIRYGCYNTTLVE